MTTANPVPASTLGPPCFVRGTRILTDRGERPVEWLQVGDLVQAVDNGMQPVRWIRRRLGSGKDKFAPVRFRKGAAGNSRDLLVSPRHRMLVGGREAELNFGAAEILVPAVFLVKGRTVTQTEVETVEYLHLLLDGHEIVMSNGAATESLLLGDQILREDPAMCAELTELFPEKLRHGAAGFEHAARPCICRREARVPAA